MDFTYAQCFKAFPRKVARILGVAINNDDFHVFKSISFKIFQSGSKSTP